MKFIEPLVTHYAQLTTVLSEETTRVTIADNLADGGTTPSKGTIAEATLYAHEHDLSLTVMIRPRGGAATYSDPELKIMEADVLEAQQLGVDGVIFAAVTEAGTIDEEAMANLIAAAGGMSMTFGTAVDHLADDQLADSIKWLSDNGVEKVLTHLTDPAKKAKLSKLANIVQAANMQLTVMADDDRTINQLNEQLDINYFLKA